MAKRTIKVGGADTYTVRDATLVTNYFPGPMRQNILQDPDLLMGSISFGAYGNDEYLQGPGTYSQALPNASMYQPTEQLFPVPSANSNRMVSIDSRQIAGYQVQQLKNNPLSIYSTNLHAPIPKFECTDNPEDYSNMINKREEDLVKYFENSPYSDMTEAVHPKYSDTSGPSSNPNTGIVFNLNYDSDVNPLISLGAPTFTKSNGNFMSHCYSGTIENEFNNNYRKRDDNDLGMISFQLNDKVCEPNNAIMYANPMVLQSGFSTR